MPTRIEGLNPQTGEWFHVADATPTQFGSFPTALSPQREEVIYKCGSIDEFTLIYRSDQDTRIGIDSALQVSSLTEVARLETGESLEVDVMIGQGGEPRTVKFTHIEKNGV